MDICTLTAFATILYGFKEVIDQAQKIFWIKKSLL